MLIKGLPRDALLRTPEHDRGRDPWTAELELMAQLVEIVSIQAAEMKLRKPIQVPRPQSATEARAAAQRNGQAASRAEQNGYRAAMAQLAGAPGGAETPQPRGGDGTDPAYGAAIAMLRGGAAG